MIGFSTWSSDLWFENRHQLSEISSCFRSYTTERLNFELIFQISKYGTTSLIIFHIDILSRSSLNFSSACKIQTALQTCHMTYLGTKYNKKKIKEFLSLFLSFLYYYFLFTVVCTLGK